MNNYLNNRSNYVKIRCGKSMIDTGFTESEWMELSEEERKSFYDAVKIKSKIEGE